MINDPKRLTDFEDEYNRSAYQSLTYADALARFTGLWVEAIALRPDLGRDWMADLDADFAVARAVNGLPPSA